MPHDRAMHWPPWRVGLAAALPLLVAYLSTTSPELTWSHHNEDGGDLVTAAYRMGIPHPTGYPWYLLTCKIWMTLFPFGTIAWRAHVYAILAGLAACIILGIVVRRMTRELIPEAPCAVDVFLQIAATWMLGASFPVWSQSIIAEVYAPNLAFIAVLLWCVAWYLTSVDAHEQGRAFCWFAAIQGLALTNHLTSAYATIGAAATLLWSLGAPSLKVWMRAILVAIAPLSLYLLLMIYSLRQPPLDWSNPETLHNLRMHATAAQFRFMLLGEFPAQAWWRLFLEMDWIDDYGYVLSIIAIIGATASLIRATPAGRAFLVAVLTIWGFNCWHIANYAVSDYEAFLVPASAMLGICVALGLVQIALGTDQWWSAKTLETDAGPRRRLQALLAVATLVPSVALAVRTYPAALIPLPTDPQLMAADAKAVLPDGALLLEVFYGRGFAWWYFRETDPYWNQHQIDLVYIEPLHDTWGQLLLKRNDPSVVFTQEPTVREELIVENLV
ncbi:MAG: DUF2723 domain-containing protein, partial [bacterium]